MSKLYLFSHAMRTCPTCNDSTKQGIRFREGASECMCCEAKRKDKRSRRDPEGVKRTLRVKYLAKCIARSA